MQDVTSLSSVEENSISTVIPFHRVDEFFFRAVTSCLDDFLPTDKLILVNDSPFSNLHVKELLTAREIDFRGRALIVRNKGKGVIDARNTALEICETHLLSFLDSDDVWIQGRRDRHLSILSSTMAPGVTSQILYICEHGVATGRSSIHHPQLKRLAGPASAYFPRIRTSSTTVRVSAAIQAGQFRHDEFECEDYGLWLRLQQEFGSILTDSRLGAKYTTHPLQISKAIGDSAIKRAKELTIHALKKSGIPSESRGSFNQKLLKSLENGGLLEVAFTGIVRPKRRLLSDLFSLRIVTLATWIFITAKIIEKNRCAKCSGKLN